MKNIETPHTPIPNLDKVITEYINNHIRFHTIQLFRKSGSTVFVPEYTGVLVEIFGLFFILTSRHIVQNSFENNLLYFKLGPEEYILCIGSSEESETKLEKSNLNKAYIILDISLAESLTDIGYKFIPNDKILTNHQAL